MTKIVTNKIPEFLTKQKPILNPEKIDSIMMFEWQKNSRGPQETILNSITKILTNKITRLYPKQKPVVNPKKRWWHYDAGVT